MIYFIQRLCITFLLIFSPLAHAAWDVWSSTLIHLVTLFLFLIFCTPRLSQILIKKELLIRKNFITGTFLLFLFFISISYLFSIHQYQSRNELYRFINYFLLWWMVSHGLLKTDKDKQRVILPLIITGVFLSILGIYQFFGSKVVAGSMNNENIYAGFLVLLFPLNIEYYQSNILKNRYFQDNHGLFKYLYFILLILCPIAGIIFARSIGGIAGFGLSLFIYFCFKMKDSILNKTFFYRIFYSFCILLLLGIIFSNTSSFLERFSWWQSAFHIMQEHWFSGVGIGCFGEAYPHYRTLYEGLNSYYVHNYVLQLGTEIGIPGMVCFMSLMLLILVKGIKDAQTSLHYAIIASLIGCLMQNMIDYNLIIPANAITFWVLAGIVTSSSSFKKIILSWEISCDKTLEKTHQNSSLVLLYGILILFVLSAGIYVFRPFLAGRHYMFANNFMKQNKIPEAIKEYTEATQLDPDFSQPYFGLSQVYQYYFQKDKNIYWLDRSIIAMKDAIKRAPWLSGYYEQLAKLYCLKHEWRQAIIVLKEAIYYLPWGEEYNTFMKEIIQSTKKKSAGN